VQQNFTNGVDVLNPAYISAFSALIGTIIGGLTSFGTTWFTQRAQLRSAALSNRRVKLETLYNDFISEAARRYADALTNQPEDLESMVQLYALASRMHLVAARAVIDVAMRIEETILETYLAPNRNLDQVKDLLREGKMKMLLVEFSEACREDLAKAAL